MIWTKDLNKETGQWEVVRYREEFQARERIAMGPVCSEDNAERLATALNTPRKKEWSDYAVHTISTTGNVPVLAVLSTRQAMEEQVWAYVVPNAFVGAMVSDALNTRPVEADKTA